MLECLNEGHYSNAELAEKLSVLIRAAVNRIITVQELYDTSIDLSFHASPELSCKLREYFRKAEDLDLYGAMEYYEKYPHLLENLASEIEKLLTN